MAIKISGTTVVDDSRNACNICSLTACGTVTLNGVVYPTGDGTAGQVLKTNGSGTLAFAADTGTVYVCEMTSSGTWTKPAGISMVFVEIISAGAGGNQGCAYNPPDPVGTALEQGGRGGAGGGYFSVYLPAPSFSATECVIVGAGGTGGFGLGSAGGCSCFKGITVIGGGAGIPAPGGNRSGFKGHLACTWAGSNPLYDGGSGCWCCCVTTTPQLGICSLYGAGGGGQGSCCAPRRGGGISYFGTSGNGGVGGISSFDPDNVLPPSYNGSPGCNYGGGGGGGGNVQNPPSYPYGVNGGCGGNGAPGFVRITSW